MERRSPTRREPEVAPQRAGSETGAPIAAPISPPPVPSAKDKSPVAFNKNDFKNDPLIQKALEIFKGQIVEVRA
jgi:hypothetical protein